MKSSTERGKDYVIKMYEDGYPLRTIARNIGVSHTTVAKRLARWGIRRRNGNSHRSILLKDMFNRRFGKLRVLYRDEEKYPVHWICACDCGKSVSVLANKLSKRKSCGCAKRGRKKL